MAVCGNVIGSVRRELYGNIEVVYGLIVLCMGEKVPLHVPS